MKIYALLLAAIPAAVVADVKFGADVSYPMQHPKVSTNYAWLPHNIDPNNNPVPEEYKDMPIQILGDKQTSYETMMRNCRVHAKEHASRCDSGEVHRINMNLNQPRSMVNFTETGVMKMRAPDDLMNMITEFYEKNLPRKRIEKFEPGHTMMNVFDVTSYHVNINDLNLPGASRDLKKKIWDAASIPIQEWTGQSLTPSSLYGVRIYEEGAILAPHVDRLPLVSSAIINVAQDVDEDWPIEIISHDGFAYNITMEPGDMVLYESHSIIHGRPYPLKGRFYANIFIHFVPSGGAPDELPLYLVPGSPKAVEWMENAGKNMPNGEGLTPLHMAAESGDLSTVKRILSFSKDQVNVVNCVDSNGWRPLHEAARAGNTEIARYLLDQGADVNAFSSETGGTALYWALKSFGDDHSVIRLLMDRGGVDKAPTKLQVNERKRTALHHAADEGDLKTLQELVAGNKDAVNVEDENGWRPLHEASRSGHVEAVKYLLENGAGINVRTLNGNGGNALHYAMAKNGEDHPVVKFLKNRGAVRLKPVLRKEKKIQVDERKRTALHHAAGKGDLKTVQELVAGNKDAVNAEDEHGWRPLHEASRSGHVEVVKYLLENGAGINIRTSNGNGGNALHYAMAKNGEDHPAVKFLKNRGAIRLKPILRRE